MIVPLKKIVRRWRTSVFTKNTILLFSFLDFISIDFFAEKEYNI